MRSQMLDLLKVVPAGLIAATNSVLPVPGTSMLTPWLLVKLGLMPSRWREAHVLSQLQQESKRLRDQGFVDAAADIDALRHSIEDEADRREVAEREASLLTHWDANQNGVWDASGGYPGNQGEKRDQKRGTHNFLHRLFGAKK